jgi:DNA polymerase I-like protein with 3'-5' exonuclease and polymerase domains
MAKLGRGDVSIINVCHYRPPDNDIKKFFPRGKPNEQVVEGVEFLKNHIREAKPKAILALGNTALWALTGHRDVSERRGSVYFYEGIPVVAAMHPAAVLRSPKYVGLLIFDIAKFKQVSINGAPTPLVRNTIINPTVANLSVLRDQIFAREWVSVDIETYAGELACVGFGITPDLAVCIPADNDVRCRFIRSVLRSQVGKIFHNAPFDYPYLRGNLRWTINGDIHDTLGMSQVLYPELPRSLAVLTSMYTDTPYYKDEGEAWMEEQDWDLYWHYNAMDCAVTIEIAEILRKKLQKAGLWEVYENTRKVLPYAMRMSIRGMRYDKERAESLRAQTAKNKARWQKILEGRTGRKVNVNSHVQVKAVLKDNGIVVPDTAQPTLLSVYPLLEDRKQQKIIKAIIKTRGLDKFNSTFLSAPLSWDGRMHTTLNPFGTETGRWSAGNYLITEGANLQTVPPQWKQCFIADEGMLMWAADYSQIEARIVAYLADDEHAIKIFEDPKGDIHRGNAELIYGKPAAEVSELERYVAKTTVHALNYGVRENTLFKSMNKRALETGIWIDKRTAIRVRQIYLTKFDKVVRWQEKVWEEGRKSRKMVNCFGRRRLFTGPVTGPLAEHTKKEMLAFGPQSAVPDLLNKALIDLSENPPVPGFEVQLNIHDALMGQGPEDSAETWVPAIRRAMGIPFTVNGHEVRIPVDIKVGKRWSEMKKL